MYGLRPWRFCRKELNAISEGTTRYLLFSCAIMRPGNISGNCETLLFCTTVNGSYSILSYLVAKKPTFLGVVIFETSRNEALKTLKNTNYYPTYLLNSKILI
jgi:hypothetical protein